MGHAQTGHVDRLCAFAADDGPFQFNLKGRLLTALIWFGPALAVVVFALLRPYSIRYFTWVASLLAMGGFMAFPEGMAKRSWKVFWATFALYTIAVFAAELAADSLKEWAEPIYGEEHYLCVPMLVLGMIAGPVTGCCTRCLSGLVAGVVSGPLAGHLSAMIISKMAVWFEGDQWLYIPGVADTSVMMGAAMLALPLVIFPAIWLGVRVGAQGSKASET